FPCPGRIAVHLLDERLLVVELFFAPQAGDEIDVNVASVYRLVKVEDVHLEQRLRAAESRPRADARDRIQRCARQPPYPRRENSHHRAAAPPEMDVGRREPELPPQVLAAHHLARHAVGSPEEAGGPAQVADGLRFADRGAAEPLADHDYALDLSHLYTQHPAAC